MGIWVSLGIARTNNNWPDDPACLAGRHGCLRGGGERVQRGFLEVAIAKWSNMAHDPLHSAVADDPLRLSKGSEGDGGGVCGHMNQSNPIAISSR